MATDQYTGERMGVRHESFRSLAKLAAALAHPLATFPEGRFDASPLSRQQVEALREQQAFRKPLDRFFQGQITGKSFTMSRRQARQLPRSAPGRLVILMMTEPIEQVEHAALLVSAAALHRQVLESAPKPKREHLRGALGGEAFHVATLEASMLYPSFGGYADDRLLETVLSQHQDTARTTLVSFGARLLSVAAAQASRPLATLALKRLPAQSPTPPRVKNFTNSDWQPLTRLFQRRMSRWATFIV